MSIFDREVCADKAMMPDAPAEIEHYPLNLHIVETVNWFLVSVDGGFVRRYRSLRDNQWVFRTTAEVLEFVGKKLEENER